jgi:hypothetical protein
MKSLTTSLTMFLIAVLAACGKPSPVVVLDSWWDVDFAKNACERASDWRIENADLVAKFGCDQVTSCSELMPVIDACTPDPVQDVRRFEDSLATQFASTVECRTVQYARYDGPNSPNRSAHEAMGKDHYSLSLDFRPGARRQQWKAVRSSDMTVVYQGEGGPDEIARQVCMIATEQGARVRN